LIVDTAGLRKKGKISESVEQFSVMRSLRAISESDVAVVLLDAVEGPTEQDAKIVGLAHEEGKGLLLVVNKWDLVEKDHKSVTEFKSRLREVFKFAPYAPLLFISAKTGKRVPGVLDEVTKIAAARLRKVNTGALNRLLERGLRRVSSPTYRGRPVKLLFGTQVSVAPPRFVLFFNQPKGVHFSILRFIKNTIRERYGFYGTDLKLTIRKRRGREEEAGGLAK
jgi:GTP-binding protein